MPRALAAAVGIITATRLVRMDERFGQYLALWRQIAEQRAYMARLLEKMAALCDGLR